MLGPQQLYYEVERHPGERKISFYVEGLTFPDADFLGLVSLSVSLVDTKVCMALGAVIEDEGLQGPAWRLQDWEAGGCGVLKPDGAPCRAH